MDIMLGMVFPVGSTYFNKTDSRNPNVILGFGTWVELGGVVLAGRKTGDDKFGTIGTIGSKTHTLTVAELAEHNHGLGGYGDWGLSGTNYYKTTRTYNEFGSGKTGNKGGGQAHNNIQPTLIGYMWERTA